MLAENLYLLVDQMEHTHAYKVTKMILELDTNEVLYLLESPDSLKLAVEEAMDIYIYEENQISLIENVISLVYS